MSDQKNIQIPKELREQIDNEFWPLLKRIRRGEKTNNSLAYETLLVRALKYTDLATGAEKPAALPDLAARPTRVRLNQILKHLRKFGDDVDLDQLADDNVLKKEMDTSGMLLWASGPDGGNIHVSPLVERYTGCSAAQFRDGGWIRLVHPEDREKTVEAFKEHFRQHKPLRVWYRLWRAEGVYGWVIDYAEPRLPNGDFRGYVGTMNDVNLLFFEWCLQQQPS